MKNTLKSILAIAMVLCMLFTVAGCGNKGKETESEKAVSSGFFDDAVSQNESTVSETSSKEDTTSADTQSDATSSSGDVTTVIPEENKVGGKSWKDVLASMPKSLRGTKVIMYNWNPATEYTGAPAVMDNFKKQTGITVEWRTINYAQYFTKLPALIASGENIPDMVRMRGPVPSFVQNMQPLSVAKYDFTDKAWDKNVLDLYTFNGKQFAVSLQNTHIGAVNVLFYNKSLIDKYDFEDPYKLWKAGKWDWDKYIEMCEDAMEEGCVAGSNGEGHFGTYLNTWGISGAISYNGKSYNSNFKNKDFLTVHQLLGDLYNKEKLFNFGGAESFNDGKVLFSIGTAVHARKKNSYFGNLKAANTLYMVPMPSHPELKKYYQGHGEAEAYGIPKGAKNPTAVPYFLRFFLDGANYELSTYFGNKQNLEVYNWCMSQKNKVYAYGYPDGMGAIDEKGIQAQTGAQMKSYIDANNGSVNQMVKEYNETAKNIK